MAKVNLEILGKDKGASAAVKGVTGSIIKASLAIEGLKIATKALINIGKQSIENFRAQEKQEKQLEAVLKSTGNVVGLTADEIKKMASAFQETTNYGDAAVLGAQNLLLTFTKIGKDVFPAATETVLNMSEALGQDLKSSSIQLGKALNDPITGASALRRVGVSLTDQQIEQIRVFQESGNIMKAQQVILDELAVEFGGAAAAARDTFGGSLEYLKNVQGDTLEAFGKIISIVGKDFVDSMADGAKAIGDFLRDSDKIARIGATFEVLKIAIKELVDQGLKIIKDIAGDVKESWDNLMSSFEDGNKEFGLLDAMVRTVSAALSIAGKIVKGVIIAFLDLIRVAKETAEVLGDVWQVIRGKKTWKEVGDSIKDVGTAFKDLAVNSIANIGDLVATTIKEFDKLTDATQSQSDKWKSIYDQTYKDILNKQKNFNDESLKLQEEGQNKLSAGTTKFLESDSPKWTDWANSIQSIVSDVYTMLKEEQQRAYEEMLEQLDEWKEEHLDSVDDWVEREMEKQGVKEETNRERLEREKQELQDSLSKNMSAEDYARVQNQIKEKEDHIKRNKIKEEGEKKKEKIEEKAAKKALALKKKQFQQDKAWAIAEIWINAGTAVMGWWSAFASMGIAGIVLAAVMTVATLAMAGVQTGIVASRQFSGEQGGLIPTGNTTGDSVTLNANRGEALLRNDDYKMLVESIRAGKGGGRTINIGTISLPGVSNAQQFVEELNNIQRYEKARQ